MISLQFEPQELDYVFKVLTQRPYAEVAGLLAKIQQQVQQPQAGNGLDKSVPMEQEQRQ